MRKQFENCGAELSDALNPPHVSRTVPASVILERLSDRAQINANLGYLKVCINSVPKSRNPDIADDSDFEFIVHIWFEDLHFIGRGNYGVSAIREVSEKLINKGFKLQACINCKYYITSGMLTDYYFGTEGKCRFPNEFGGGPLTLNLHRCEHWLEKGH